MEEYKCSTTLTEQIAIRMTKADREKLEAIAQKHWLSLSGAMLKILREYEVKDNLPMKTAGLQSAIDQHMTAIKELNRVKRMYKRELRAANKIRVTKDIDVPDKSATDICVGDKERTTMVWKPAKGRPAYEKGICSCGYVLSVLQRDFVYCPMCGCRLEWNE